MKHQCVNCKTNHSSECPWAWLVLWELAGFGHLLHDAFCEAQKERGQRWLPCQAGWHLWSMFIIPFLVIRRKVHPMLYLCGKSNCVNFPKTDVGKSKYCFSGPVHIMVEMQNELLSGGSAEGTSSKQLFPKQSDFQLCSPPWRPKTEKHKER